jgi:uncharacterized protein (DUF1697 family)
MPTRARRRKRPARRASARLAARVIQGLAMKPGVHVALLRAINVGGNNKLPMKDLVRLFESIGCGDVRTYIQSGNVVYTAGAALAKKVPALAAAAIEAELGLRVPVVTRTAAELADAARARPFEGDDGRVYVAFLADTPSAALIAALDPNRSPGDRFTIIGRDMHVSFAAGAGKTKITNAWIDAQLGTVSTLRNLRTIAVLVAMTG